jgi:histidine phosphotransfer protein HptB
MMWKSSFDGAVLPAGLDEASLIELRLLMEDDFPLLLQNYISDARRALANMDVALEAGDAGQLRRVAHSLKGSTANLGAKDLVFQLQEVERCAQNGDLTGAAEALTLIRHLCLDVILSLEHLSLNGARD